MSEQIHEQISAFLDDELSAEESAFLVRRLSSDSLARRQTIRYTTIGSVLREEAVLSNSTLLRDRIHAVLDGIPVSQSAVGSASRRSGRWTRLVAAAGVAGAVAVSSLLGLRALNDDLSGPSRVQSVTVAPGAWTEPDSYVVPGDNMRSSQVAAPPIRLTNYLMQHGNYASTLNRTSVNSHVIGKLESDPAADSAEVSWTEVDAQ
jgi:negative regulator of sigma E activity